MHRLCRRICYSKDTMVNKPTSLLDNSRFYILATSFLLSVALFAYVRLQIPSDQLLFIRMQQLCGLLCIFYWYIALVISPIGYIIGKQRTKKMEFARRAIGVSAFYFAFLHATIAVWGQLGGLGQLQYLPALFKWSLLGGAIALAVLAIMAATSFDKVVAFMTFRRWKWLHRLGYAGGILAVLHIWTIGTHLSYDGVQLAAFIALAVLSGLELVRVTKLLNKKYLHFHKDEMVVLFICLWGLVIVLLLSVPLLVKNYHGGHTHHTQLSVTSEAQ